MEFAFICRLLPYEGKQSQQHKNKCASEWLKQSVANETYTLEPESIQTHIAYTEREWVERARWHTGNGTGHAYYAISFHVFSLTERVYVFVYIIWVRILAPFAFGLCMCECVCVCSSDARAYEYQLFDYNVWVRRKECVCSCVCVCVSVGADRANNKHTAEQTTFHINRATTTSVAATNVFYFCCIISNEAAQKVHTNRKIHGIHCVFVSDFDSVWIEILLPLLPFFGHIKLKLYVFERLATRDCGMYF